VGESEREALRRKVAETFRRDLYGASEIPELGPLPEGMPDLPEVGESPTRMNRQADRMGAA
jgi:hypothetical protein